MAIKIGVITYVDWAFRELYEQLAKIFEMRTYKGYSPTQKFILNNETIKNFLANRIMDKKNINGLMKWGDLTFFDWASHLLEVGTQLPKHSPMITRLHRWELFEFTDKIKWNKVDMIIFDCEIQITFLTRPKSQAQQQKKADLS